MPITPEPGDKTASQIQEEQFSKPVKARDTGLITDVNAAIVDTNIIRAGIKKDATKAGLATNNLDAEPVFDAAGNIKGYRIKNG
jgi:hypothetical protein